PVSSNTLWAGLQAHLRNVDPDETGAPSRPTFPTTVEISDRTILDCANFSWRNGARQAANPSVSTQPRMPEDQVTMAIYEVYWRWYNEGFRWQVAQNLSAPGAAPVVPVPTAAPAQSHKVKVSDPKHYNGEKDKFEGFLSQLS